MRSITSATCFIPSATRWPFSPRDPSATPKKIENTTICRISLLAIASMALLGTRCVTNSFRESDVALTLVDAPASGSGMLSASPGRRMLTITRPIRSETRDAPTNQASALPPTRPTDPGVAHVGDPDHERREHERCDDHLDQAQEDVA